MNNETRTQLEALAGLEFSDAPLYVVGGTLRDRLRGRDTCDLDFTCRMAPELASRFAENRRASLVVLDDTPERETHRVVIGRSLMFDFTRMQGNSIEQDLAQRDFTINAMAQPLDAFLKDDPGIIDPQGGRNDLRNRTVRVLPGNIFESDPLRILRAARFATTLQFQIEPGTLHKMVELKSLLNEVSEERLTNELQLILKAPRSNLGLLINSGILETVIPEFKSRTATLEPEVRLSFWNDQIIRFNLLEDLVEAPGKLVPEMDGPFREYLAEQERAWLVKAAGLLYPLTPPTRMAFRLHPSRGERQTAVPILKRLKWSNASIRFIERSLWYGRLLDQHLEDLSPVQRNLSALYRLARAGGEDFPGAILLSAAHRLADPAKNQDALRFLGPLVDFYFKIFLPAQGQPALLNGDQLSEGLGLAPSPIFKVLLERVEEARVLGTIATSTEALAMARNLLQDFERNSMDADSI